MKKGFVLITSLAVVIVIALGAAAVLQAVGSHANMKANNLQEVRAQYLALAGVEQALWQCRQIAGCQNTSYTIDGTTVPISATSVGGSFTIQTTVNYTDL